MNPVNKVFLSNMHKLKGLNNATLGITMFSITTPSIIELIASLNVNDTQFKHQVLVC